MKISSNVVGDSNDGNSFPHKVPRLRKAFANNSLTNIKLSKNQFRKIGQSGGFSFR